MVIPIITVIDVITVVMTAMMMVTIHIMTAIAIRDMCVEWVRYSPPKEELKEEGMVVFPLRIRRIYPDI